MIALVALQFAAHAQPQVSTTHETPWQIIPTVMRAGSTDQQKARLKRRSPVTIQRTLLPGHPGMESATSPFVACMTTFTQSDRGWTPEVSQCKGSFLDATQAAVDSWEFDTPAGLTNASFTVTIVFTNKQSHDAVLVAANSNHIPAESNPWFVARDYPHRPHRMMVSYPSQATNLTLPQQVCSVEMTIDTRGRPSDVQVWGCHSAFRDSLADELSDWRFEPFMVDGQATPVPVATTVRFRPKA